MRRLGTILLAFALALGCTGRRSEAVEYATAHAGDLVTSTRALWSRYRALPTRDIPPSEYPATVRALDPALVVASKTGLMLYIYSDYAHVSGVFIRHDPTFVPPSGIVPPDSDDWRYERLAPDVYWSSRPR